MGFFGSKKTYVASQVWNLAGDEAKRPNYLKSTVVGSVLSSKTGSIAEDLENSYLGGPGIKLRAYYRWCLAHYNTPMLMWSQGLGAAPDIDPTVIAGEIPHAAGETVLVQAVRFGLADFEVWAEQWVLANYPADFTNDWSCEMSDLGVITVTLSDASTHAFTPSGFDKTKFYVYAAYLIQDSLGAIPGAVQMWIYQVGSGVVALDDALSTIDTVGDFFSPIPIRTLKTFLSETHLPDQYALAKRAYRRLTQKSLDALIDKISDNDHLDDIDFAYVNPAVSLNVKENACKKYLYNFFQSAMITSAYSQADLDAWDTSLAASTTSIDTWNAWANAQSDPLNPLYGTSEPPHLSYTNGPANTVNVHSDNPDLAYHIEISWAAIKEEFGSGAGWTDAKRGEVKLETGTSSSTIGDIFGGSVGDLSSAAGIDDVILIWQVTDSHWSKLTIRGLVHRNYIYSQHYVEITGPDALADTEESGFLVPLHFPTMVGMSLVDTTQMSTACLFLVLNSYKIVKLKWYQTGFFQVILVVLAVVIAIYTGQYQLVAGALGLSGTAGVIIAAILTVAIEMIGFQLIDMVLTAVFGAKIAAVLEVVMTIVTLNWENFVRSASEAFHLMMRADVLLKITEAVLNGATKFIAAMAQDVFGEISGVQQAYKTQEAQLSALYAQNIGYDRGLVDPMSLMADTSSALVITESRDAFLSRTLMTGSDVANLSFAFLHNFSDLTLTPLLPT